MENDKKKITQGYVSKLKNHEELEVPEIWDNISTGVRKNLFFRFSWHYFNIYYLMGISSIVALLIGLAFYQEDSSPKKDVLKISEKTIYKKDTSTIIIKDQNRKVAVGEKKILLNKETIVTDTLSSSQKKNPTIKENEIKTIDKKTDTLQSVKNKLSEKPEVKKPVIMIRKRDTIVEMDTIKIYKKKRRR